MNKRGHIGTALLPFIAFILIINAFYVMYTFNGKLNSYRSDLNSVVELSAAEHESVKENIMSSISEAISSVSSEDRSNGRFEDAFRKALSEKIETYRSSEQNNNAYAKLSLGNYNLSFNDGLYTLTASDIFEDSKYSNNEIRYSYSLNVLFDKDNVISVYID